MSAMKLRTYETMEWRVPILAAIVFSVAAMMFAVANPAKAQDVRTFTVTNAGDREVVGPNDACISDGVDGCTLREAVVAANAVPDTEQVVIDFDVDDITLTVSGSSEGEARTGDLDISRSVTIDGGNGVTVSAGEAFNDRIFEIFMASWSPTEFEVTIESLTIEGGETTGESVFGGGIFVDELATLNLTDSVVRDNTATFAGGGVYISNPVTKDADQGGTANITDSVITGNTAAVLNRGDGLPAGAAAGIFTGTEATLVLTDSEVTDNNSNNLSGGIASAGDVTIRRSTISGNTAVAEAGGIGSGQTDAPPDPDNNLEIFDSTISGNSARSAGGIGVINTPALVANSTISGNTTTGSPTTQNQLNGVGGGAAAQGPNASLSLESVTIAENTAPISGGGALASDNPNAISAVNTIVADNTQAAGGQCAGAPIESNGFNLDSGESCGFETENTDPLLGNLQNNGGSTATHALPDASPAVDQGNTELASDQRGEDRPSDFPDVDNAEGGSGADIGAFELQVPDETPPNTTITAGPGNGSTTDDRTPTFRFTSSEPNSTFECRVDEGTFFSCESPFTTDRLSDGRHTFEVRATDEAGNVDPTPARRTFIVDTSGPNPDPNPDPNACTITGTSGNDVLRGTPGRDVICGLGGNDVIRGLGGNDLIRGGPGNDRILGGSGNDTIRGGTGKDVIRGGDGDDRIFGEEDNDALYGEAGDDALFGGPGNDVLRGGSGRDQLDGGPGKNSVRQ